VSRRLFPKGGRSFCPSDILEARAEKSQRSGKESTTGIKKKVRFLTSSKGHPVAGLQPLITYEVATLKLSLGIFKSLTNGQLFLVKLIKLAKQRLAWQERIFRNGGLKTSFRRKSKISAPLKACARGELQIGQPPVDESSIREAFA
jgi:hypothetical protein